MKRKKEEAIAGRAQQTDIVHERGAEIVGNCGAIVGFYRYPEDE